MGSGVDITDKVLGSVAPYSWFHHVSGWQWHSNITRKPFTVEQAVKDFTDRMFANLPRDQFTAERRLMTFPIPGDGRKWLAVTFSTAGAGDRRGRGGRCAGGSVRRHHDDVSMEDAVTEQKSTGPDAGRPIALSYDRDTTWVSLPESFPYGEWQDRETWARTMTLYAYFRFLGDNPPPPDLDWAERTFALIEFGQQRFADGRNWDQFLLFFNLEEVPLPVTVNAYLGSRPWDEVGELFSGAGTPGIAEGPTVEYFEVEGAETAQRSLYFQQPDPDDEAMSAHYVYTVRRDGYDIVVQA